MRDGVETRRRAGQAGFGGFGVTELVARRVVQTVYMSGQTEHEFVKAFVNILASQPVTLHDDFQEQPEKTLKKVPVVQVSIFHSDQMSLEPRTNITTSL